jgi:NADPH:quinone reductase-like Zn-dependent oxidoreductase
MLIHKPKHMSWEEAAGIPEVSHLEKNMKVCDRNLNADSSPTWITATQALYLIGEFNAGKSVLWHAGASSVSIAGIQLAKAGGASAIYVTASSEEKIEFCRSLGSEAGFNYKTQDWAKEILNATDSNGVDIVEDPVGAQFFQGNLDVAARDGRIVTLGALGGTKLPAGVDIGAFVRKRIRFEGSSLRSRDLDYQGKLRDKLESFLPRFKDGTFKVFIEKVFRWEDVIEAHKLMESNQTKGKLICVID